MKKNLLILLMVLTLVLTACGGKEQTKEVVNESVTTEIEQEEVVGVEETVEETVEVGELDVETTEVTPTSNIESVENSADNPAKVGIWVKSSQYSTDTKKYHEVEVRLVQIERESELVQKVIDKYIEDGGLNTIEPLEQDDLEYCYVDYEVYIPKEFPKSEYGLVAPTINLTQRNPEGGGFASKGSVYIGLPSTDISEEDEDLQPGETFKGRLLYVMVKGETNYIFEAFSASIADENISETIYFQGK